jgi:predicted RNA-binding Zn-ribbon protein involved in translation (DUF1610 family)
VGAGRMKHVRASVGHESVSAEFGCPNCGAHGIERAEHPGVVSSGIDFECGAIWDDSPTSDFKAQPARGCIERLRKATK